MNLRPLMGWLNKAYKHVTSIPKPLKKQSSKSTKRPSKLQTLQQGQGMVEYVIIVALVAVAAIGVFQLFGQVIRSQTAAIALELAGEDGTEMAQQASATAQSAIEQTEAKSLQSYTGNAQAGQ